MAGEHEREIRLSVNLHFWVFVARLLHIVCGFGAFFTSIPMMAELGAYYYGNALFVFGTVVTSAVVAVLGFPTMFACRRPNDVHWHLTLSLDYLAFLLSLITLAFLGAQGEYLDGSTLPIFIPMVLLSVMTTLSLLVPIITTHTMNHQGMLPSPHPQKQHIFDLEQQQQQAPKPVSYYEPEPSKPESLYEPGPGMEIRHNVPRVPSHADTTAAGTTARWSGISGADTTAFRSMMSERDVPPYSSVIMSPRGTTIHSKA